MLLRAALLAATLAVGAAAPCNEQASNTGGCRADAHVDGADSSVLLQTAHVAIDSGDVKTPGMHQSASHSDARLANNDEAAHAFQSQADWIVSQGGKVNEHFTGGMTQHGGANIRGVITRKPLTADNDTHVVVPRKLWLTSSNFQSFADASKLALKCADLREWEADRLFLAAAIATEAQKGTESYYYPYIHALPSMRDFQSFMPNLIEEPLKSEFAALPIVATAKAMQRRDEHHNRACFEKWQGVGSSPVASLTWDEMLLALTWVRTRNYYTKQGITMIVGTDMLNTGKDANINTGWGYDSEAFYLRGRYKSVEAGSELYDSYCPSCDNEHMLKTWGVYLEDNPATVAHRDIDCSVHKNGVLQKAMEATLETSATSMSRISPRCRSLAVSTQQGPLRCSLARLTWEYCAVAWGLASPSKSQAKLALASVSDHGAGQALSPEEDAMLVFQSSRMAVPMPFHEKAPTVH